MQDFKYLIRVVKFGKIAELEELIDQGADLNRRNEDDETALNLANKNTYISAANLLRDFDGLENKY